MSPFSPLRLLPLAALALTGCNFGDQGALQAAWIGDPDSMFVDGIRLSPGAQHLRAATDWGLVALDAQGEAIPALAERWIITEDGMSFIFRLREQTWPDGTEIDSASVRRGLERAIAALDGTSLALDLAPVQDIRAMAGRVVEIRLSAPVPDLLHLLAQPELALRSADGGTGPMLVERDGALARLRLKPPLERGLPDMVDWEADAREIDLTVAPGDEAIALFDAGTVQLVLGGRLGQLPQVDTGPLSRGTVRIDPAIGLFGLQVRTGRGMLADPAVREALAMALDRPELLARYNVGGWVPTTRVVAPGLPGDPGYITERWSGADLADLRREAASRVRAWRAGNPGNPGNSGNSGNSGEGGGQGADGLPQLTLSLGDAPGDRWLLRDLAAQFATIGIRLVRAEDADTADLVLVDQVARYADPRWFLNQFHCSLRRGLCDEDADYLVELVQETPDSVERATLLAEAEAELLQANIFIPIGAPLRWSLVRGSVTGFLPNAYAFHPLPPLAERTR